jgi:hypothetical protein
MGKHPSTTSCKRGIKEAKCEVVKPCPAVPRYCNGVSNGVAAPARLELYGPPPAAADCMPIGVQPQAAQAYDGRAGPISYMTRTQRAGTVPVLGNIN